jgi:Icc-related predicted phosphoesterase
VTRFTYVHITDLHLCQKASRVNVQYLMQRNLRHRIDTGIEQAFRLGIASLAQPASYIPHIVSGVAQFCLQWRDAADGIIISGDIATTSMAVDMAAARVFVLEPARQGFMTDRKMPTLEPSNLAVYITPGNHDRYLNNLAAPNSKTFELTFGNQLSNFNGYVGYWVSEKDDARVAFLYADFSLRTRSDAEYCAPFFAYGQGRAYQDVLDDLKNRTLKLREEFGELTIVWITHFAPFDCGEGLKFIDYATVTAAAVSLGVLCTLCGHTHKSAKFQTGGHTIYCGGSAGCADSPDNSRVQVINVDVEASSRDSKVSRQSFEWSASEDEFRNCGWD